MHHLELLVQLQDGGVQPRPEGDLVAVRVPAEVGALDGHLAALLALLVAAGQREYQRVITEEALTDLGGQAEALRHARLERRLAALQLQLALRLLRPLLTRPARLLARLRP